jgi:5-formyltetrahydrofolate cyclo-ligase
MAEPTPEVRAARRRLRALRLSLDARWKRSAEQRICMELLRLSALRRGARVGVYLAMPGEVDLRACFARAWRRGIRLHVPRIASRRRGRMHFVAWTPRTARCMNTYGIEEPAGTDGLRPVVDLDVVVLPTLGFDRDGNRLGMGAGFYDRALQRRRDDARRWRRPRLVGVAFACQELPAIPASPWDVRLDVIVTEREVIVPRRHLPGRTAG